MLAERLAAILDSLAWVVKTHAGRRPASWPLLMMVWGRVLRLSGRFAARATEAAAASQARAETARDPALMDAFPNALLTPGEPAESARSLYRNWVALVAAETISAREPALV